MRNKANKGYNPSTAGLYERNSQSGGGRDGAQRARKKRLFQQYCNIEIAIYIYIGIVDYFFFIFIFGNFVFRHVNAYICTRQAVKSFPRAYYHYGKKSSFD